MNVQITKIQILSDREHKQPLFYCHAEDQDHNPTLIVRKSEDGNNIVIESLKTLYKVKGNPQTKNRVDIYMPIALSRKLGELLLNISGDVAITAWFQSQSNPAANARGRMELPIILWSKSSKFIRAQAKTRSGIKQDKHNGRIFVDLEYPRETHIKMKSLEIHIGVELCEPSAQHDEGEPIPVRVPEEELQKGKDEQNPVPKVRGDFAMLLTRGVAAGLGALLQQFPEPTQDELSEILHQ